MATLKQPKIKYAFHLMLTKAGGTKYDSAKLKIQLLAVVRATAFPRTRRGKSSGG